MQDILGYKHEESACILAIEENEVSKFNVADVSEITT